MVQLRMGLPGEYVEYTAKLAAGKQTAVITPFGITERFRRAAGLPQGGTESCALFDGVMDILADMQDRMSTEQGALLPDQFGELFESLAQIFCDDAHYSSSGERNKEGLEERFRIAALFCAFTGMKHRATKSNAALGEYTHEQNANKSQSSHSGH